MEWYLDGSEEPSMRFPSPESWPDWRTEAESFSYVVDANLSQEEVNFSSEILSNKTEMESCTYDKDQSSSSNCGELSEDSLHRTALSSDQLAYQLRALARFEQMDDLFVTSLIDDFPGNEDVNESFCFESELQNDMVHGDPILTDMCWDTQSTSTNTRSMGSLKYLKTHAFSPSMENGKVSSLQSVPCNSEEKHSQLVTAPPVKVLVPSKHDSVNGHEDKETSLEESVLKEMEMMMSQLNDKTRICFRDALYRLAKNSRQQVVPQNQNGNLPLGTRPWTGQDEKIRHGGKKTKELETNTIDRAIANLMFNKKDLNVHEFPVQASATTSNEEILKANSLWIYSYDIPCYPNFSRDAEVPILSEGYSQ